MDILMLLTPPARMNQVRRYAAFELPGARPSRWRHHSGGLDASTPSTYTPSTIAMLAARQPTKLQQSVGASHFRAA